VRLMGGPRAEAFQALAEVLDAHGCGGSAGGGGSGNKAASS
jgi:hypothetical protein